MQLVQRVSISEEEDKYHKRQAFILEVVLIACVWV